MTHTMNLGATPCCGLIKRDSEDEHTAEDAMLDSGICPDCRKSFVHWLATEKAEGLARRTFEGWCYNYNRAVKYYIDNPHLWPEFLGYEISRNGCIEASACCNECRAGSRGELSEYGQGHFQCDSAPKDLLAAETLGLVSAHYEDGWRWYVNQNANPMIVAGLALDALYDLLRQVNLFLRKKISFADLREAARWE